MAIDLSAYGLIRDPFPLEPGSTVTNWAGRREEKEILTDIVYTPRSTDIGSSEFAVIHGDYGNGKSHSMRFFEWMINNSTQEGFESLAVYIPTTKMTQRVSFLRLYEEIINIIGSARIRSVAVAVDNRFVAARRRIASTLTPEQHVAGEGQEENLDREVFRRVGEADLPMLRLMRLIADGDDVAMSYLRGSGSLPDIGFPTPVSNDFIAAKTLGAILRILTLSIDGQPPVCLATYLFLDEVETVLDDRQTELNLFFQGIRNLVNELPYNFCFLMAFSADTALLEAVFPQAVLQRMTRDYVELSELEPNRAKEFIAELLEDNRPQGFDNSNRLHPFAEESIELVIERLAQITPRRLFRVLNAILIRSIRREGLAGGEEISANLAEAILDAGQYY